MNVSYALRFEGGILLSGAFGTPHSRQMFSAEGERGLHPNSLSIHFKPYLINSNIVHVQCKNTIFSPCGCIFSGVKVVNGGEGSPPLKEKIRHSI